MSKGGAGRLLVMLVAVTLGSNGCTTMQLVPGSAGTAMPSDVGVGKHIRVLDRDGVSTDLEVLTVGADYVEGRTKDDRIVRFALADIRQVRERRLAPGKTALLTVGVLYVAGLFILVGAGGGLAPGL
jgi:hypothetical protein